MKTKETAADVPLKVGKDATDPLDEIDVTITVGGDPHPDGLFIAVEGIDGAGKSTVVDALADEFDAVVTSEPSSDYTGEYVRDALQNRDTHPLMDFFLFMADRVNHIQNVIKPALREGKVVISDRYADSTRAYQQENVTRAHTGGKVNEWIEACFGNWNIQPDLTIYVDVPVDVAMERVDHTDKYESRSNLLCVRQNYEELYRDRPDVVWIDGTQEEWVVERVAMHAVRHEIRRNAERGPFGEPHWHP